MKYNHKNIVALLLFIAPFFVFAQNDISKINFIKAQCTLTNSKLKSLKKITKEDTAESTEGNEVLLYFDDSEIKKIQATYYGETGKAVDEYYFFNKKLIFYYRIESRYVVPINVNSNAKIASVIRQRYYFNENNLFMVKIDPKRKVSNRDLKRMYEETEEDAERLLNLK